MAGIAFAALTVLAMGMIPASASPAGQPTNYTVTDDVTAQVWTCSVNAVAPETNGIYIYYGGSQSCSGSLWAPQRIIVGLERWRGVVWTNVEDAVVSPWTNNSFVEISDLAFCDGSGHYTYRTYVDGQAGGSGHRDYSEERRYEC